MKTAALLAVVTLALGTMLWAADDVAIAPQQGATVAPVSMKTVSAADAITIPQMMTYQGRLTDASGVPVPDGNYSVAFKLYTAPTGGSPFWNETQSVTTRDGLFSTLLGSVTPIGSVPNAGEAYLGMAVAGDAEMTPRLRIAGAAYTCPTERAANAGLTMGSPFGIGDSDWVRAATPDSVLYTIHRLGIAKGEANNKFYGIYNYTQTNFGSSCTVGTNGYNVGNIAIGGGYGNRGAAPFSTVCGGRNNKAGYGALDTSAIVVGGYGNAAAEKFAVVVGGQNNTASGVYATVPGGYGDTCAGDYAMAAGDRVQVGAAADRTFAFGENFTTTTPRAVVFYHSGGATKLGVGIQDPTWNADVSGKGRFTGKLQAAAGFKVDTAVADSEWATKGYVNSHGGGGGGTVTSVRQGTGIVCTPSPITDTGRVRLDTAYSDTRYVNEGQANSVTSGMIVDGTIVNADISASANIAQSKISNSSPSINADKLDGYHYNELPAPAHDHMGESWTTTSLDRGLAVKVNRNTGSAVYGQADTVLNSGGGDAFGGVFTVAGGGSGNGVGGYFEALLGTGSRTGVFGRAYTPSGSSGASAGVEGIAQNDATSGTNAYGGLFYANGNGPGVKYAVYANALSGNGTKWAGYFDGNVHVAGTLSKAAGSFLIDHPQDPMYKTLRHNFVESPENLCLYRGKVQLGADGRGEVEMPAYFTALTKEEDATVTLTPVGRPFTTGFEWNPEHTTFTAYGEPGRAVCYIVLADRDDPVMRQLYRPPEEEKGNGNFEKGKLLYPTAYGYPEDMGVDAAGHAAAFEGNRQQSK